MQLPEAPEYDPDNDSDFDCIDISLNYTRVTPRQEVSKDDTKDTMKGNIALDSGYTSSKENTGSTIPNESLPEGTVSVEKYCWTFRYKLPMCYG